MADASSGSGPVEPEPYTGPRVDWLPLVGSDGEPIAFNFTNDEFAERFLPTVRMIFLLLGVDRDGLTARVRDLVEQNDESMAIDLAKSIGSVADKFAAIAEFARAAGVRLGTAMDEIGS